MMGRKISLLDEVRYVKGVGPKKARILKELGIRTVKDLLNYFPFRLQDFSKVTTIDKVAPGDEVTAWGRVASIGFVTSLRGRALRVEISDNRGRLFLVWYNMPYLHKNFKKGQKIVASGRVEWRRNSLEIAHPMWKKAPEAVHSGPVIPVYHGKGSLTSSKIHSIIKEASFLYGELVENSLPLDLIDKYGFLPEKKAYRQIHLPDNPSLWEKARRTFAFREVLYLQIALSLMKRENQTRSKGILFSDFFLADKFLNQLPFKLTRAQARTIENMRDELMSGKVMNRLIQGDVGSGKTVVAIWALLASVSNGCQGVFLAPTEVLARQHKRTLETFGKNLANIGFLSGSLSQRERKAVLNGLFTGEIQILVGTHAILEPDVKWKNLGLVVTDEQHRFGVKQRLNLSRRSKNFMPHILVMSATPIPRSLALTLYGDLDISVLDELPQGRKIVKTKVLSRDERVQAYMKVRDEVKKGHQAYVVCPLIREGKSGRKAVEQVFQELKDGYLKDMEVGFIHGDIAKDTIEKQMALFVEGKIDVLVSTTVIEVGVDVANATCIVVEDADSFGLATLHQLRGRVGRGHAQSYCYLIASCSSSQISPKLRALEKIYDGFAVAELDLKERGPGQFFGTKQHGLPELKIEELGITREIIIKARDEAERILKVLESGEYSKPEYERLVEKVRKRFGNLMLYARSR